MRLLLLLLAATAVAQSPQPQSSHTTESLRGISAVSRNIAWASGTHGTYLRTTNAGRTWILARVPDTAKLDFRAVVAFSAAEAFLMSAGPGDLSRIYHTTDAGQHWQLQFTNSNPKGFFDSMVFWDPKHGVVLGDPVPDENGKLKFELLMTEDGKTWRPVPPSQLPEAIEGEGAFAASNTCLAILRGISPSSPKSATLQNIVIPRSEATRNLLPAGSADVDTPAFRPPAQSSTSERSMPQRTNWAGGPASLQTATWKSGPSGPREAPEKEGASVPADPNLWFATGGKVARVFHSADRGQTWTVSETLIIHGPDSAGIFSIAFHDALHGMITGGDYKHPNGDVPNLAKTDDGGKTWRLTPTKDVQGYVSAIAFDPRNSLRRYAVGPDYIAVQFGDSMKKYPNLKFNAVSVSAEGAAFFVGPKGAIATIP